MLSLALIVVMALAARAHGVGENKGWPAYSRIAGLLVFSLVFGFANYLLWGVWQLALIGAAVTAFGLRTGHGRFFAMRGANLNDSEPEWIERNIARWAYKGDITSPAYSWFCMGIKGLIIGLPLFPLSVAFFALWPLAYAVSFRFTEDSELAEWITGGFAGLTVAAIINLIYIGAV